MNTEGLKLKTQIGFTLIEVVISITLLALITMILYGAFYLGHRAKEKTEVRSEENLRLRTMDYLLGGYIRSAYPYRSSLKDPAVFFSGEKGHLTFISAISTGLGGRGMSKVSISWDEEPGRGGSLILEEEIPVRLEDHGGNSGYKNSVVLQQGVKSFRIDYLDPKGEEESWIEEWEGRDRKILPRAIRFSILEDRGEIRWVFPIMMSVLTP